MWIILSDSFYYKLILIMGKYIEGIKEVQGYGVTGFTLEIILYWPMSVLI